MNRPADTEQANHPEVHLNLNVRGLQTSPTLAINERSRALDGVAIRRIAERAQRFDPGLHVRP